ncbi:MAG: galactokinase family protein, partial [Longimicrobiales bacterium]
MSAVAHSRGGDRDLAGCFFVPGRIEVLGKHTDYAGGRSLLAAVHRGFVVAAAPRPDGAVQVI